VEVDFQGRAADESDPVREDDCLDPVAQVELGQDP
jgi:hypothetical protein